MQGPDLSIIIPAYNEESRLPRTLEEVRDYLDASGDRAEVVVVENGSSDRTPELADQLAQEDERIRVLHLPGRGKGLAVRHGVLASTGRVVLLCDADLSVPIAEVSRLEEALQDGADIAIASREAPGALRIGEPLHRHLMGRVFNWIVRWIAVPGLTDTQCGFKAFRGDVARDLFERQRLNGFAFDVEVLFLAKRLGYRIVEVPVTWHYGQSSRVRPVRDTISMLMELGMVRWNAMRGYYG